MHWYHLIKFSQIWNIETDGSYGSELSKLYELEYKYSMLKNYPFKGLPKKKENIIKNIEKELIITINEVLIPLKGTFENWLEHHAILNPQIWAEKRIESEEDEMYDYDFYSQDYKEKFQVIIDEYMRYLNNNTPWHGYISFDSPDWDSAFNEILDIALQNINNFPTLKQLQQQFFIEYKTMLENEIYNMKNKEEIQEFGEGYKQQFSSKKEAINFINNMGLEYFNLADYIYNYNLDNLDNFINTAKNYNIDLYQLLIEFNQNLVFPLWYQYWKNKGIDKTRKRIETTFKKLDSINMNNISQAITIINIALNEIHQNGLMLNYLEQNINEEGELEQILDSLSEGKNIEQWNQELKSIGVKI